MCNDWHTTDIWYEFERLYIWVNDVRYQDAFPCMVYFLFDYYAFLLLTSKTMICKNLTEKVSVKCFAICASFIVKLTDHFITFN